MDVWPYMTDVLRRLPAVAPNDTAALEALLPDRWVVAHPKCRLEQREKEPRKAQARGYSSCAAPRRFVGRLAPPPVPWVGTGDITDC